jgi:threonine/homoserine/homoserine lactone efflux protein
MLALITIFFTSLLIAFSGAMMPGPLLTITISESAERGAIAGPLLITGHAILEMFLVVALLLGLGPVLKHPVFFMLAAFVGGAIMFWMAWGMFKSLPSLSLEAASVDVSKKKNLLFSGALMSLANPYWIIWWATIGIGYIIHSQKFGIWGIVFFFLGHIAGDYIWYTAISVAVSKGKSVFTNKVYRIIIGVCGAFLVGFAIFLVLSALSDVIN